MDTRGQRRPRRLASVQQQSSGTPDIPTSEAPNFKKDSMDKSAGGAARKRRTPPTGVSDEESRQDKKVKIDDKEPSRRQRSSARAARNRNGGAADEDTGSGTASKITADVASDQGGNSTGDEEKHTQVRAPPDHPRTAVSRSRRTPSARAKQERDIGALIDVEPRPNRRRANGGANEAARTAPEPKPPPVSMRGNEVNFGHHWRNSKGLSFDTATKVLMATLRSAKQLDLAEENMQICAECRGGGDLLCCDCCPLAFHSDCLEPLERPACLFVPIPKHGLKAPPTQTRNDADKATDNQYQLRDSEWFCPYCLSHPIMKLWKRGVPRLLTMFQGFGNAEDSQSTRSRRSQSTVKDQQVKNEGRDAYTEEDASEQHREQSAKGNVAEWMAEVEAFASQAHPVNALFPPNILLALSGIRRAIQRHGALYSANSKKEFDRISERAAAAAAAAAADAENVLPLPETDEPAEPSLVGKNDVVLKAPIMGRRSSGAASTGGGSPPMVKSDEEQSASNVKSEAPPRRSTRRAQALAERRALAARAVAKPIVREKEGPMEYDETQLVQAKINVGASFQVPGVNRHFLEAKEFGLDYLLFDQRSVCAYLPMDHMGRIPTANLHLGSGCRLVYSATELRKRQERLLQIKSAEASTGGTNVLPAVPLDEDQLTEFTKQVISLWPVWVQWPPTQEFALKLLHHCRYDTKAALRLLCSDALQFRAICDPPIKPYMNKWRPRDRRGHMPSIPFPPPSNAIALMGVGNCNASGTCA
eukprot:Blabericola_migrator_1__10580@NODE_5_length_29060_cov_171_088642_g4_i0_p3_GENE_NODE_5_length_29060_cov_171_088642_g4_i0NODE_5_length_29060_cov_171_088642_g4_i0_p3_ORF_typecomplete_len760_score97_81EELM2/PF15863_5/2_3e44PHD/PF00628_29/0_038_NODE_5_length_29060_cov_171_088642_g4_i0783010109